MRLIDADSFMAFEAELPIKMGVRYAKTASFFFNKGCETVLEAIDAAPTIDPESLRPTAHWITDSSGSTNVVCSACNAISFAAYNFCQHCGKRMVNADESL